uniref:STAS domain-containing protein n=1 Tax=Auxenochlorella protothecoides TaxID=3075 RepID=A0A1D2AAL6_AUXPR
MTHADDASSSTSSLDLPLLVHHPYKAGFTRIQFDPKEEGCWQEIRTRVVRRGRRIYARAAACTWTEWVFAMLPCLSWLRVYPVRDYLWADISAGLSVAAMVIPQGMSYASLAGLPSAYGLYGAFVPCLVYSLLGSSRQLAVGPVAITSVLLGSGLPDIMDGLGVPVNDHPNHPADPDAQALYNQAAVQVAFLAGCLYTAIGALRLGWLTHLLSHAVISGFTTGASITIAASQLKWILGVNVPRSASALAQVLSLVRVWGEVALPELAMGSAFVILLLAMRVLSSAHRRLLFLRALGPLGVCTLSIAITGAWRLDEPGPGGEPPPIHPVGRIVPGLPAATVGWWLPLLAPARQLSLAAVVCLVDVCESISIARTLATANKYRLAPTRELLAMGVANLAGSAFNCYTTTGSFSRSAVSNAVGAKTPLAGAITGGVLLAVLAWLTPLFTHMSANVQGAIIIVGVLGLFDYSEFLYLYKVNKLDWIVWLITFFVVLFAGVEIGIGVGVGVSLVLVIWRAAFPAIVKLGKLPDSAVYRNVKLFPDTQQTPGVLVMRVDAPFFFANVESIRDGIVRRVEEAQATPEAESGAAPVRYVVLDMGAVTDVDATSIHWLTEFVYDLKSDLGVQLVLSNLTRPVLRAIKNGNVHRRLGPDHIFVDTNDAVVTLSTGLKQGRVDKAL